MATKSHASGSLPEDDDDRNQPKPRAARRVAGLPRLYAPLFSPAEHEQFERIVALAAESRIAEERRAVDRSPYDAARMPAFGEDTALFRPTEEARALAQALDESPDELKEKLFALTVLARDPIKPTPENMADLIARARAISQDLGSYLCGKSCLDDYLQRGFHRFMLEGAPRVRRW